MDAVTSSETMWPAHLKPQDDELLSSWIVRLALAHGLKLHTFCSLAWPGKQIWNRDVDKSDDQEVVKLLSVRTGTSLDRARATSLAAYESVLYEKHNRLGPSPWIMPIGVYHRTRRKFGLQFCPLCLAEDKQPYYRRKWRLAFVAVCEKHEIQLHDRCPECGAAVNFHRYELRHQRKVASHPLTLCPGCNFKLHRVERQQILRATSEEANFTSMLLRAAADGFTQVSEDVVTYSCLFFAGLRQLMKILAMRDKRITDLRRAMVKTYKIEAYVPAKTKAVDVQELEVEARRKLLGFARCLLEEWPKRFVELSGNFKVWSSVWLRHLDPPARAHVLPAPFWYWSVIHDHLYRAKYCPSNEERKEAIKHLRLKGMVVNKSALARLLGVAVVR